ncbi:hypothetical protein APR04_003094 [Promicromonospora umidemergens]|uniref:Phosphoribosylamine--glycine ligase n=1 Tax=Promicromonospora umidemergens TaxID=629679 RepID=A0ABP8XYE1_9MICO|nr:hypothetical protein [Promicromonospora umidemergens]MCP2284174.1 hypothetical protein [Promicromonospora umidemergens]
MELAGFIVGSLGLLVASLSVGWQAFAWVYDGRRVRVALVHGLHSGRLAATGKVGGDRQPRRLDQLASGGFAGEEVIGIAVTNVGRATVRIDKYGVALVRGGVSFHPLGNSIGPDLPFRLPPGETETWYARMQDAWKLIHATKGIHSDVSPDVRMLVTLGTGDDVKTRHSVIVPRRS